jgi:hypothetical protein
MSLRCLALSASVNSGSLFCFAHARGCHSLFQFPVQRLVAGFNLFAAPLDETEPASDAGGWLGRLPGTTLWVRLS